MRLDTDSADLRARLAEAERERDATQRENAELRRRLREMMEAASQPRGTYRPSHAEIIDALGPMTHFGGTDIEGA